jgi:hypothetical protein
MPSRRVPQVWQLNLELLSTRRNAKELLKMTAYPNQPFAGPNQQGYLPLAVQTRTTVSTNEAAFHMCRKAQTLRMWACYENGPIRPVRVNGRLAWRVADIMRVMNGGAE